MAHRNEGPVSCMRMKVGQGKVPDMRACITTQRGRTDITLCREVILAFFHADYESACDWVRRLSV